MIFENLLYKVIFPFHYELKFLLYEFNFYYSNIYFTQEKYINFKHENFIVGNKMNLTALFYHNVSNDKPERKLN